MSDFDGFDHVIGRASDLLPDDYVPPAGPVKESYVAPASREELERPSPEPFIGRADPDFPELDSLEQLYIPKYLIRRWGWERFERSPYRKLWQYEAERSVLLNSKSFAPDLKPSEQKGRK